MSQNQNAWRFVLGVSSMLFMAGCNPSGGGLFGFFGGTSGSDSGGTSGAIGDLASSGGSVGGALNLASVTQEVATVSNPEPASMVLFGGGAAGLALIRRRRKSRARSSR